MGSARPELIFLTGPQAGERAVLMTNAALVGRAASADVRLQEEAASREQLRFQFTAGGWLMENLSANGTLVNGKRYKRNKKLLLDTGDVIGAGMETEILYVAPGDDPEEALAAYRQKYGVRPPEKPKPAPAKPEARKPSAKAPAKGGTPGQKDAKQAPSRPDGQVPEEGDEESEQEQEQQARSKKLKYILFGVIVVGMVGFGIAIIKQSGEKSDDGGGSGVPPRLASADITAAILEPMERSPSRTKAAETLDAAVRSYSNRALWEPGDLFLCVRNFKLHRAYSDRTSFAKIEHERWAADATKKLDQLVQEKYEAAWKFEKAKDWRNAKAAFEELLVILPVAKLDREGAIYRVIIKGSVIPHLTYIKDNIGQIREY